MFAKLYGTDNDQVLVKIGDDANGDPEVRVFFRPKGLGICSFALGWDDDSAVSLEKAEAFFDAIDEDKARKIVESICKQLGITTG